MLGYLPWLHHKHRGKHNSPSPTPIAALYAALTAWRTRGRQPPPTPAEPQPAVQPACTQPTLPARTLGADTYRTMRAADPLARMAAIACGLCPDCWHTRHRNACTLCHCNHEDQP